MPAPTFDGLGHIDLTVTDAEESVEWWREVMGFDLLVGGWEREGFRGWTMVHPSGLAVTLLMHDGGDRAAFDERRVGLDHLALQVRDYATLEAWASHLDARGVQHSGIQDAEGKTGGPCIVLRDPDNIQLELTAGWHPSK
jgi:glyoxylase I family protein